MPNQVTNRNHALDLLHQWREARTWLDTNQHIVDISIRQCHRWIDEGHGESWGISGLYERLRWILRVKTVAGDQYNLNNNMKPFLARWVMHLEPTFDGLFERKYCGATRADDWLIWTTTGRLPDDIAVALTRQPKFPIILLAEDDVITITDMRSYA